MLLVIPFSMCMSARACVCDLKTKNSRQKSLFSGQTLFISVKPQSFFVSVDLSISPAHVTIIDLVKSLLTKLFSLQSTTSGRRMKIAYHLQLRRLAGVMLSSTSPSLDSISRCRQPHSAAASPASYLRQKSIMRAQEVTLTTSGMWLRCSCLA